MGCTASCDQPATAVAPPQTTEMRFAATPAGAVGLSVVHHAAAGPGDSHHAVSLTSSTYGCYSLLLPDPQKQGEEEDAEEDCVIVDAWEMMEGLPEEAEKTEVELKPTEVVLYTTSLRGVRQTYEDCKAVERLFLGLKAAVDVRDMSMDAGFRRELQARLGSHGGAAVAPPLPQVFVGGRWIGGGEEVLQMHEVGELGRLLEEAGVPRRDPWLLCGGCGGGRFLVCGVCSGSRKIVDEDGRRRRCTSCNENGLVRCPACW